MLDAFRTFGRELTADKDMRSLGKLLAATGGIMSVVFALSFASGAREATAREESDHFQKEAAQYTCPPGQKFVLVANPAPTFAGSPLPDSPSCERVDSKWYNRVFIPATLKAGG